MLVCGPVLELAERQMNGDAGGFAGCEMDALEACQQVVSKLDASGRVRGLVEIDLDDLVAGNCSGVLNQGTGVDSAIGAEGRRHF